MKILESWRNLLRFGPLVEHRWFKHSFRSGLTVLSVVATLGIFVIAGLWMRGALPQASAVVALLLLAAVPSAHWLLRHANISVAFHLVALALFAGQTILLFANGASAAGLIVLLFPAVVTGLLINGYVSSFYAVAGLLVFGFAQFTDRAGGLSYLDFLESLLALLCVLLLMLLINRGVVASLRRERRLSQELEKHKQSLEEEIRVRTEDLIRSNEALRRNEAHQAALIRAIPDLMFVIDENLTYQAVHAQEAQLLVFPPEHLLGRRLDEVLPPHVLTPLNAAIEQVFATGETQTFQFQLEVQRGLGHFEARVTRLKDQPILLILVRDFTEQKRLEEELRQAESLADRERVLLRGLIDNLPDYVYVKDASARFIAANAYAQQQVGAASERELIGKTDYDFFPKELADAFYADDMAVICSGRPILHRLEQGRDQSGHNVWIHTTKAPLLDSSGQVMGLVGMGRDVTELKEAQVALEETERIYRQAIGAAGGVPYRLDLHTKQYTFVGDEIETLTGYRADEMTPALWHQIALEQYPQGELRGSTLPEALQALRSGQQSTWRADVRIRTKSGATRWVSDVAVELYDEQGQSTGSIGFLLDITERKRIEMALKENETLFRTLFEQSPDGIFLLDPSDPTIPGRIVDCNAAACRMNGYHREELIGQPITLLNTDEEGKEEETFDEYLNRLKAAGSLHFEIAHRRADGTIFPVDVSTTAVTVNGRDLVIGFDRDITDRRAMENELRRAKDAAEAANQAKSEFLANMSHEIRTPMNAVVGMTSLLLDTALTDEQLHFVNTIRSSGDHLLAVINDILDFSKIESGKLELESVPFDLRECVETSAELFAGGAARKGLELVTKIDGAVPEQVTGDPTRLRQVLTNLLSNALKFTRQGEIVVEVTCPGVKNGIARLDFAVRDTGIGIPADSLGRLFKSFSQVDASTTRKYGGTGLGLAISQRICQVMGGDMGVESVQGQGSTFHFYIHAPVAKQTASPSAAAPFSGRRLLVVDDNQTAREWTLHLARRKGMTAVGAADEATALELLDSASGFDAALIDIRLDERDGIEFIRAVAKQGGERLMPVILHAPPGQIDTKEVQETEAIRAVLPKPLREAELERVLSDIFLAKGQRPRLRSRGSDFDKSLAERLPLRILLAEDNLVNQQVGIRLLAKLGYRADVAANGEEVLEALRRQPYDLILMDVQMPEMDGLEATRQIQAGWPQTARPYIVALTAHAHDEARNLCEEVGMDDYVTKPVRTEELSRALSRAATRRARPDATEDRWPALPEGR